MLKAAKATVWGLRNDHESAIPSGSTALERIRKHKHDKKEKEKKDNNPNYKKEKFKRHNALDSFPATHNGASLAEIEDLAGLTELKLQMVRRDPGAEIPIPSVMHLNEGHFATVVEHTDGRYKLDDPLLGGEVWMSQEALEEAASGYFLIEQGPVPAGHRKMKREDVDGIRGKCVYAVIWEYAHETRRPMQTLHRQARPRWRNTPSI